MVGRVYQHPVDGGMSFIVSFPPGELSEVAMWCTQQFGKASSKTWHRKTLLQFVFYDPNMALEFKLRWF